MDKEMPADVLAYVAEVEGEYKYPTDADSQFRGHAIRLCRIVRERQARIADLETDNRAVYAERDALHDERDALRDRLAKLETASGALVSAIYEGEDGRSASIVRRPCDSKSCKGLVCGPIEEFWRTVSEFQAVLAESKVPR